MFLCHSIMLTQHGTRTGVFGASLSPGSSAPLDQGVHEQIISYGPTATPYTNKWMQHGRCRRRIKQGEGGTEETASLYATATSVCSFFLVGNVRNAGCCMSPQLEPRSLNLNSVYMCSLAIQIPFKRKLQVRKNQGYKGTSASTGKFIFLFFFTDRKSVV